MMFIIIFHHKKYRSQTNSNMMYEINVTGRITDKASHLIIIIITLALDIK